MARRGRPERDPPTQPGRVCHTRWPHPSLLTEHLALPARMLADVDRSAPDGIHLADMTAAGAPLYRGRNLPRSVPPCQPGQVLIERAL